MAAASVVRSSSGGGDGSSMSIASEDTAAAIDEEVSQLVEEAYRRATEVLVANRPVLDELAEILVEKETVDAEELQELLLSRDVKVATYV